MAVLKYKKKDGSYATLTNISIKPVEPVQTTGSSTTDVMSQAAVTTELANKLATSDFNTYSGTVDTLIGEKASQSNLNTLSGTVTGHTADTFIHVTTGDKSKWDAVTDKLDKSAFNTYSGSVDTTISGKLNTSDFNTYSGTVSTEIGNKVDKVSGKGLSTNDFTTAYKDKLDGIASGAEVNVQADWSETATTEDSYILNKPTLGTAAEKGVSNGITNSDNLIESKHIYSGVVTTASYNSTGKTIDLKSTSGNVLATIDATDFIKDGMVSNVEIKDVASSGTCLVITFNTDSGKDNINIPISQIFNASNYYTKDDLTGSSAVSVAKANSATTAASASSVAWNNVSGKPDTYTPSTHTHDDRYYTESELTASTTTVVVAKAASATTAANADSANAVAWSGVSSKPDTATRWPAWTEVTSKPETFTPSAHNHVSSEITGMTSYSKPSTTSAISTGDTLNAAIGKLEKALDGKQDSGSYVDTATFNSHTGSSSHMSTTEKTNLDSLATNIAAISSITSTKVGNWDSAYNNSHTHSNKAALDSITGDVGTMAYQNTSSYSSATQVSSALSGKSDTGHTHSQYLTGITSTDVTNALGYTPPTQDTNTTYAAGSFITITGTNNSINVSTGTSNSTVARGDHNHNGVYQPVGSYLTAITSSDVTTALGFTPMSNAMLQYSAVTVTGNLNGQVCPVTLTTNGQQCNVLYVNNATAHTVSISTNSGYVTPDGNPLTLNLKANGYGEVNYLYYEGTIYARGV